MGCSCRYLYGARCRLFAYGPADTSAITSFKSSLVLPFWYRLTVTLCYSDLLLDLWLTGPIMHDDWSRDSGPSFCVVLWLCCGVLRLIVLFNWVLFCIIHFHIKRNRVVLCFGVCSAPSCDTQVVLEKRPLNRCSSGIWTAVLVWWFKLVQLFWQPCTYM